MMKKNEEWSLTVERFADQGKVLAKVNGYVVFFKGAAPGDIVRVRTTKVKKNYAEAILLEVISPSPLRVSPICAYFGTCGGCKWQHVAYEHQLTAKRESVADALTYTGGFQDVVVQPTIGMENPLFYRNKMEFSFSTQRWFTDAEIAKGQAIDRNFALGLHAPGRFDKVLDLEMCYLQSELSARIVNGIRQFAIQEQWLAWDTRKQNGFMRHVVIRQAWHTQDLMVNLVTYGYLPERMHLLATFLQDQFPEITTFVNTCNTGLAQTAYGESQHTIYGSGKIYDKIGDLTFEIAPTAFFQTNTSQAEKLYAVTRAFGALQPTDLMYDLYCGAGTISLFCAPHVQHVVGVELVEEAVANARGNAQLNNIHNTTFVSGDMMRLFTPEFVRKHGKPDVLVVDPPRAGMHPKVVAQIAQLQPERWVYVSCNPMSQARELKELADLYAIEAVQPVDMFPHTHHTESVIKLRLRS
ncbi:MAG: 23S rRNA (uracil(1939)-C(5))-methyltransferase RlmD [Bacteroidetes Order II. Incertae sedis bacterium]|nr:23S rRNA (uracil(1939)-C(5))-methyltransferase RlmD [Bacteroidetes Order II. bacterium]